MEIDEHCEAPEELVDGEAEVVTDEAKVIAEENQMAPDDEIKEEAIPVANDAVDGDANTPEQEDEDDSYDHDEMGGGEEVKAEVSTGGEIQIDDVKIEEKAEMTNDQKFLTDSKQPDIA